MGTSRYLSKPLLDAIRATLDAKRQSLLFINRRGSASSQICGDCGHVSLCPNCQLPLTFHADQAKLICHTCNYQVTPPAVCPDCGGTNLRFLGVGTKRVEDEIKKFFPAARVARLDKDSLVNNSVAQIYQDLVDSKIDILIGTQMIAKGLDLPNVDTVGVVSADTALYLPDYTASERTFQLTAQVSGRAGRGDRPGQVIIQSYTPEHPAITAAASHDFWRFMDAELDQRQTLHYPPFVYLLKLTFAHTSAVKAQAAAQKLADTLKAPGLQIVGPAPAFREQAASKYHWQLVVKSPSRQKLIDTAKSAGTGWTIDLDPINLL